MYATTKNKCQGKTTDNYVPVLIGGDTNMTPSPRTNSIGIFLFVDWKVKKKWLNLAFHKSNNIASFHSNSMFLI